MGFAFCDLWNQYRTNASASILSSGIRGHYRDPLFSFQVEIEKRSLAFRQIYLVSLGVKLSGRTDRVVTATNAVTTGYSCVHRIR